MSIDTEMTAPAHAPVRTDWPAGFGSLLRAEWTKFRTVRGWVIGMIVGAILFVFLGVFASNANIGCGQKSGRACLPAVPIGPGGEAVTDTFYFVRQPLSGNGSITARIVALTGMHSPGFNHVHVGGGSPEQGMVPGLVPWAKVGVIVRASTKPGSSYAAMMVTGDHGVRWQYDYTNDTAGLPGAVSATTPRWLRLNRSGDTITGYDSADGVHWTRVGAVTLAGLPRRVQVGLFATSPKYVHISPFFGGASAQVGPSVATGVFDRVHLTGATPAGSWTGQAIGLSANPDEIGLGGFHPAGGTLTVSGSGDIAPIVPGPGGAGFPNATIEQSLVGGFIGLIAIVVIAAMFFTSEYRRGLIRTTLAATPRRGQLLAAKAVVIALVAFVVGLVAAIASIALGVPRERAQGLFVLPVSALTEVRVIVGTAAVLAVAAVLALCLGTLFRRSAAAIVVGIVAIVLPFLFSVIGIFPSGVSAWLLRLTPAAGFAIEQSIPQYPQVSHVYSAAGGYYPLPPWAGFAVLCAWAAAAAAVAVIALRRRDA